MPVPVPVPVRWSPSRFALTHEKALVLDGRTADILTFNFTARYYSTSRDFGIVDRSPGDVSAITRERAGGLHRSRPGRP